MKNGGIEFWGIAKSSKIDEDLNLVPSANVIKTNAELLSEELSSAEIFSLMKEVLVALGLPEGGFHANSEYRSKDNQILFQTYLVTDTMPFIGLGFPEYILLQFSQSYTADKDTGLELTETPHIIITSGTDPDDLNTFSSVTLAEEKDGKWQLVNIDGGGQDEDSV